MKFVIFTVMLSILAFLNIRLVTKKKQQQQKKHLELSYLLQTVSGMLSVFNILTNVYTTLKWFIW